MQCIATVALHCRYTNVSTSISIAPRNDIRQLPQWLFTLHKVRHQAIYEITVEKGRQMPIRSDAVGLRVRVYWTDEDEWFGGRVQEADEAQGYFVLYDDGDERWESQGQRVEFEDGEQQQDGDAESDDDEGEVQQQHAGGRAPVMMEPPASPTDDGYDDDDAHHDEEDETQQQHHEDKDDVDAEEEGGGSDAHEDGDGDVGEIELASAGITRAALHIEDDGERGHDESDDDGQRADSDDDGEQSIAMSEVPITFERGAAAAAGRQSSARNASSQPLIARSSNSNSRSIGVYNTGVNLPVRGVLRGRVLRASHLPSIPTTSQQTVNRRMMIFPPRAFVKIAFAEAAAGENQKYANANIMLRCKNALATTSVAMESTHPVWNDEDSGDAEADGAFQMRLVPPLASSPKEPPAWLQLRGDVLFSVYSVSTGGEDDDDGEQKPERGRRQMHDFIGQAVLSLTEILRHVLFGGSMSISRHLPLQSRQGKPLVPHGSRASNAFSDDDGDDDDRGVAIAPEIVVSFEFDPTYLEDIRQRLARSKPTSQSIRSLAKDRGSTASGRSLASQPKNKEDQYSKQQAAKAAAKPKPQAKRTTHTSSSTINRRKFEKQVDQQNVAFAKRLEWRDQRRVRLAEHAKAQAKSKQPIPQHGAMKLDHKASSGVNRTKFQQQVRQENRAMEKRLHAIIAKDAEKEQQQLQHRGGGAKGHHEGVLKFSDVGFDDLDKDKVLARDRRQIRLREQDFLMERAQTKYQQQNQVVEEVMTLQAELAELKTQVFNAKAAVTRLDILNNKDQHLCKCLRSAAESSPSVANVGSNCSGGGNISIKRKTTKHEECGDGGGASGDAGITRQRKELELLKKEAASLCSETQGLSQELKSYNQQEQELDDEVHKLGAQLRFVQKKQAFQLHLSSKAGAALQFAKEMKKKQQLLELSKDEEELWALYQAQQELTQLQIAVQVLKERSPSSTTMGALSASSSNSSKASNPSSSSSAACEYLEKKIERQKQKLEQLELEQSHFQRESESLLVSGEQEALRRQVHELQQTLFLCQAQQKHTRAAQKHANFADEKLAMEFQAKVFQEQTETEILFKKKR